MKKELLFSVTKKDLKINYFSGTGAGGQYRNKHQNCVRIRHDASGAIVTGQSHRERKANEKEALSNLVANPKFKLWHASATQAALTGKTIDQRVDEAMTNNNLKIEIKDGKKWVPVPNHSLKPTAKDAAT